LRLTATTFLTIDGVMQGPGGPDEDRSGEFVYGGWLTPYADMDMGAIVAEQFADADAFLLGRRTYETMQAYWSQVTDPDNIVAVKTNQAPKYVVSSSLESATWNNSTIIRDDVVESVRKLKELPGKELQVHGSAELAQTLIRHRLVDEYRLWIFPVALGTGKRLFGEGAVPTSFERADVRTTDAGVTVLVLRPVGEPQVGAHTVEGGAEAITVFD
jgi:dihydrofolate reductase